MQSGSTSLVFASWSGKFMDPSMVTTQLNKFWHSATNISMVGRISSTLLHKISTAAVHGHAPDFKKPLSNLMNHDLKTAEKQYFLQPKKKTVTQTSKILQQVIRRVDDQIVE